MNRKEFLKISAAGTASFGLGGMAYANGAHSGNGINEDNNIGIQTLDADYYVPNRFKDKTIIVTGCARGMGAAAAIRLGKEGANVVGVDWIEDKGAEVIESIKTNGGNAIFVYG